jgi:phosphatidate cytidylyltransferase
VGVQAIAGREAVLLLIATVAVSDTAQFYTGQTFGRTPLAPLRSPKKTREGAVGGFVIAPAFLAIVGSYFLPIYPWWWLASLGLGIVVAGIIGDLFESMLKRAADLKDSGTLIPGHGGVLDRIDALLFAAPVFYFFLRTI